jgi:hypothetical protein
MRVIRRLLAAGSAGAGASADPSAGEGEPPSQQAQQAAQQAQHDDDYPILDPDYVSRQLWAGQAFLEEFFSCVGWGAGEAPAPAPAAPADPASRAVCQVMAPFLLPSFLPILLPFLVSSFPSFLAWQCPTAIAVPSFIPWLCRAWQWSGCPSHCILVRRSVQSCQHCSNVFGRSACCGAKLGFFLSCLGRLPTFQLRILAHTRHPFVRPLIGAHLLLASITKKAQLTYEHSKVWVGPTAMGRAARIAAHPEPT